MMKKFLYIFFAILAAVFTYQKDCLANELFNSKNGLKLLERSEFKQDFYQLVNFYQAQINPLYCSAASSVIVLNALSYGKISSQKISEVTKPNGEIIEFKLFTQQGFFNEKTNKIKQRDVIEFKLPNKDKSTYDPGLNLKDLSKILSQAYKLKTKKKNVFECGEKSLNQMRNQFKEIFNDNKNFIIANFEGTILEQKSNGHFSPLVAFDSESDSVLVLDTALHKNTWFWTPLAKLCKAMNTKDGDFFRGYLIISN